MDFTKNMMDCARDMTDLDRNTMVAHWTEKGFSWQLMDFDDDNNMFDWEHRFLRKRHMEFHEGNDGFSVGMPNCIQKLMFRSGNSKLRFQQEQVEAFLGDRRDLFSRAWGRRVSGFVSRLSLKYRFKSFKQRFGLYRLFHKLFYIR